MRKDSRDNQDGPYSSRYSKPRSLCDTHLRGWT